MDVFDRIMSLPLFRPLFPFWSRHREVLLYLFFGGATTAVSIAVFWLMTPVLGMNELAGNAVSWVAAVLFAFVTNRIWVFKAGTEGSTAAQAAAFFTGRLGTLGIEELIIYVFVTVLGCGAMLIKLVSQIVVIVLNYFISKFFVFKNSGGKTNDR